MAIRLLYKIGLLIGLVAIAEGFILFSPVTRDSLRHGYLDAWRTKHEHLVGPGQNRIILTGGSNVAFGVDSSKLQSVAHRATINMGMHAGLGLSFMLHEVEDGARRGDLVILMPEYEHFYGDLLNGERTATELVQHNPTALRYFFSWRQWRTLVTNTPVVTSDEMFASIDSVKTRLLRVERQTPESFTVYRRDAFDEHGDMVAHLSQAPNPNKIASSNGRLMGEINQLTIDEIARCRDTLMSRGADFVVIYPTVAATYWALNRDLANQVATRIPGSWTLTMPAEWVFDDQLFYDSVYHLNRTGRDIRTAQLIQLLQDDPERYLASPGLDGREAPRTHVLQTTP